MPKPKVYLETTLFNYYFDTDRESHKATVAFFNAIKAGVFEAYTSQYALDELADAPEQKQSEMMGLTKEFDMDILKSDDETIRLADIYLRSGGIPKKKELDARHIAIATVNNLDLIVSCNFKHINKLKTKRMVLAVNLTEGYKPVTICRPEEVVDYEDPD
jgi:predicted nucleic acid-binding protein